MKHEINRNKKRFIFQKFETIGISPIPDNMRNMNSLTLLLMWLVAPASATAPVVGYLLHQVGINNFLILVLIATVLGVIPGVIMTEAGRVIPLISVVISRLTFGTGGSVLFSLAFSALSLSWFAVSLDVGVDILNKILMINREILFLSLGLAELVLIIFGIELIKKVYYLSALCFIIIYSYMIYYLVSKYGLTFPRSHGAINWGHDIDLLLTVGILGWAYEFSTISRFCRKKNSGSSQIVELLYMLAPSIGLMSSICFFGSVGMISYHETGIWNIALIGLGHSELVQFAAMGIVISILSHNAMNLYPPITKMVAVVNDITCPHKLIQPTIAFLLTSIGTCIAINNILKNYERYLHIAGPILFTFTSIFIVDWYENKRYTTELSKFFIVSSECMFCFNRSAIIALLCFLLGIIISFSKIKSNLTIINIIPWEYFSAALSGFLYYAAIKINNLIVFSTNEKYLK